MEESITYIKYADWNNGELPENGCLLMSAQEFIGGREKYYRSTDNNNPTGRTRRNRTEFNQARKVILRRGENAVCS